MGAGGQLRVEPVQGRLDLGRDRQRVGPGQLVDLQVDGRMAVIERAADGRGLTHGDAGDVRHPKRQPPVVGAHHRAADGVEVPKRPQPVGAHGLPLGTHVGMTEGRQALGAPEGPAEVRERDVAREHGARVGVHLDARRRSAVDRDARDAVDGRQARLHLPLGEAPQGSQGIRVAVGRRIGELEQGAHRGGDRGEARRGQVRGQARACDRHALGDELACAEDVGAVLEEERHDGEAGRRGGADRRSVGGPEQGLLEGRGHALLHGGAAEPGSFRLHDDHRGREARQGVEVCVARRPGAYDQERDGGGDDEVTVPDRGVDDGVEEPVHRGVPRAAICPSYPISPRRKTAPRTTTRSPLDRPELTATFPPARPASATRFGA